MFYLDLFRCLHEYRVRYLLVGGLAMNLHGVPRMTMDVDIVLALDDANLDAFFACARQLGLKPQAPVPLEALKDAGQRKQWIESKNMIAFALAAPGPTGTTVDVLIHHPLDINAAFAAAVTRDVGGVPVPLCAVKEMITLKCWMGRKQDFADIRHLSDVSSKLTTTSPEVSEQQGGFSYWISDEQLRAYMALPLLDRLRWLEAARQFTLAGQTPETRERMERLRRGETII